MIEIATTLLLFIAFMAFAAKRGMTYMHVYQQEEYDSPRFLRWMFANKVFDKRLSLILVIISIVVMLAPTDPFVGTAINFLIFFAFAVVAYREKDPRKQSKKKLVLTARAKRIFIPAYVICVLAAVWCFFFAPMPWLWILNIQLIPFAILFVNMLLIPSELAAQKKFWNEAHNKVMEYKPTVIGITGSFGKTSVKHILGHILKSQAPTLITPGSVNTPMGISRIVREQLEPNHTYFVVEMGAYGHGSIERLCNLTPPDVGIITAVGHAHYERFKSLEAVAETKYELAKAVVHNGGNVITHERTLRFEYARTMKAQNESRFIVCGERPRIKSTEQSYIASGDLIILSMTQTSAGLHVIFKWGEKDYDLHVPLFGLHHGHNVVQAFACAMDLGVSAEDIQASLLKIPQIEHRLEVRKPSNGLTIIDDAYNSNPIGFNAALGLLAQLGSETGGRKILITPGMVELGGIHESAHRSVGEYAGEVCDIVIVVKGERIPSFIDGFKARGEGKELMQFDTFTQAEAWITKHQQDGDIVLLENDLPDLYERVPKM